MASRSARLLLFATLGASALACSDDITGMDTGSGGSAAPRNMLYVQSNNTTPGENAIVAFRRDSATGQLTHLGSYRTGGRGHANPTRGSLGPNDLDDPIIVSPDRRRMFAVNAGSNTIAVLDILADGSLRAIAGSPFPSGGTNPVSLGLAGDRLFVVNKDEDANQLPMGDQPNYASFSVGANGALSPIPGGTVSTVPMASPSHALISRNGQFVFGADFLAPFFNPGAGSVRALRIGAGGALAPASLIQVPPPPPGVPAPPPGFNPERLRLPLGLWTHPSQNILYVGHVTYDHLGVYNFDPASGALSFVTQVRNSGREICWIRTNAAGTRLFTVNNIDNSVSWYDIGSNPRAPVERQKLTLKEPGPMFLNDRGPLSFMQITSTPFQPALSPDERFFYVINQRVDFASSYQQGNNIHIVRIASDGTLSEPGDPVQLTPQIGVPVRDRPHGVVVF